MNTYTYKTVSDLEIQLDVYLESKEIVKPCIVWIHGGALIRGSRSGIKRDQLDAYLKAGYAVVSIDYRLAPETKLEGIIGDLTDAMRWTRNKGPELFNIDPDRIGVVGHSAGGYLTLMSGFRVEPSPQVLVSFYGYGDIVGDWYSKPDPFYCGFEAVAEDEARQSIGIKQVSGAMGQDNRNRFYLYCRQNGLWPNEVAGRDPNTEPDYFAKFCPVQNVDANFPPTLLLHGDSDTDVPYEQSVIMANELNRYGVEHELITIKGGPHGFDGANDGFANSENAKAFNKVIKFLDAHLK